MTKSLCHVVLFTGMNVSRLFVYLTGVVNIRHGGGDVT